MEHSTEPIKTSIHTPHKLMATTNTDKNTNHQKQSQHLDQCQTSTITCKLRLTTETKSNHPLSAAHHNPFQPIKTLENITPSSHQHNLVQLNIRK